MKSTRSRQVETPSERKNRELFEQAGSGYRPFVPGNVAGTRRFYLTGATCDACANWETCVTFLGKSHAKVNYCARPSLGFLRAEVSERTTP